MTVLIRAISGLTLFLAVACTSLPETPNEVQSASQMSFIGAPKLVVHSQVSLNSETRDAFDRFKAKNQAFGAMYVRPDGRGWSWHTGNYELENAQQIAKIRCDLVTGQNCLLYATLVPLEPAAPNALPADLRDDMQEARLGNNPGGYIVVARNGAGDTGFTWNYNIGSSAQREALRYCEIDEKQSREDEDASIGAALEKAGFYNCKIHGVYK